MPILGGAILTLVGSLTGVLGALKALRVLSRPEVEGAFRSRAAGR